MTRSFPAVGLSLGLAVVASSIAVSGQGVFPFDSAPPEGLTPGAGYRIAFITDSRISAVSKDIEEYNSFAQSEALENSVLAGLPVDWRIIGSTGAVDARDNTQTNPEVDGVGEPIFLVDGRTQVASSNPELWDGLLDNPIYLDQNGLRGPQTFDMAGFDLADMGEIITWTGTKPMGTADLDLGTAPAPFFAVTYGSADFVDSRWIERHGTDFKDRELPVFVLSTRMVAVPEPAGLMCFGLGIVILRAFVRRIG